MPQIDFGNDFVLEFQKGLRHFKKDSGVYGGRPLLQGFNGSFRWAWCRGLKDFSVDLPQLSKAA